MYFHPLIDLKKKKNVFIFNFYEIVVPTYIVLYNSFSSSSYGPLKFQCIAYESQMVVFIIKVNVSQ